MEGKYRGIEYQVDTIRTKIRHPEQRGRDFPRRQLILVGFYTLPDPSSLGTEQSSRGILVKDKT